MELIFVLPLALCLFAFFLGAIPFGFLAGKIRRVNIRDYGSGNIGATNVMRVLGKPWGIAVLILDTMKGYLPVILAQRAGLSSLWLVLTGLCAVLGHIFSPFVRFRGGKGVATSLGVLLGLSWQVTLITVVAFLVPVLLTRWVALGSICGAMAQAVLFFLAPSNWLVGDPFPYRIFGVVAAAFIIWRHKENIARMRAGTESRFGAKVAVHPSAKTSDAPHDA